MPTTVAVSPVRALTASDSALIVENAVSRQVPITLGLEIAGHEEVLSGTLRKADGEQLLIDVRLGMQGVSTIPVDAALWAEVVVDDITYLFATRFVGLEQPGEDNTVLVQRPESISAVDRRRTRRRRLRPHTKVTLQSDSAAGQRSFEATLLNLSAGGLACRVRASETTHLVEGAMVRAAFELGTPPQEFDFAARVTGRTEAGTPDQAVLGLEFLDNGDSGSQRGHLLATLQDCH